MGDEYSEIGEELRRPRRKMVNVLKILGGVLALLLVIEIFGFMVENLTQKPVIAQMGTMERGFWAETLFLRNESLLTASVGGDLTLKLTDGTRIPHGEIIAVIDPGDLGNNQAANTDLQIKLQSLNRQNQALQKDLQRTLTEITAKITQLKGISKKSGRFRSLNKDLTAIKQEKEAVVRNIEHNRLEMQALVKTLSSGVNGPVIVPADIPGYLFYKYDEAETRIKMDDFRELTVADFDREYPLRSPAGKVKAGAVIAKVIQPFHQWITFICDPKQTGLPKPGDLWWFKNGDNIIGCPVVDELSLPGGKILVALDDVSMLPEFMPGRRAKIFIIYKRISGIIVPAQALYRRGPDIYVKMAKGDGTKETKVVVREDDGVKAIIEGIEFGTTIISR